ncbi:MAG: hypothetical protein JRM82_01295, partial [Nitrososphaerota archaeon]|nr:hypothetical protein [Nitrososphaerota archaeon]
STLNSTTSVDGLKLSAPFNSSAVQGRNFTVTAEVINTLPRVVNVNATSMTNPADGPCQQGLATGVKVYQGNYTVANVSQATELLLYNPSLTYTCPAVFTFHYSFSPNSDIATMQSVLGGSQVGKNTTGPIKESSVLSGYWSGSGQSYTFSVFPPGDYTMVVFDAWGQTVVDRFQVAPASGGPVEVVSVIGPIPPYNPGGPVVRVTLQNIGQVPITSLNASLPRYPGGPTVPYSFVFKVNSSSPLEPGQTAQATLTMIGFGFSTGQEFPLTVSGTLSNETEFSFIVQVQIVAPGQGAVTTSSESGLVGLCPNTGISSSFGTLTAGTSSPALLCVRLYYYSAAPLTLNLTSALSIQALQYNANGSVNYPRSFSGASNFTVVASQSQLTIGGPDNENEGATVAYGVTANSGSSGTYWLGFGSSGLTAYALTPQEPLSCGFYGELVAGSGQPNYARGFNGCITYTTTSESASATASSSAGLTVPGIPYSLMSGLLYFEIVGVTSSTG